MSAAKQSRNSVHGGRHFRKKSRKPLPLPKRPLVQKSVPSHEPHGDEDYVNMSHKHKLTYLRYPAGSGKRPPPKPKRIQHGVSSPPPSHQRVPVKAPHTQPHPHQPHPYLKKTSPPQHQAVATPTRHAHSPPTRPLLPPTRKLHTSYSHDLPKKQAPPRPPKPQLCPNPLTRPDPISCPERNQDRLFKSNGYTKGFMETSLPTRLVAHTPKQPILPPAVKPRRQRSGVTMDESNSPPLEHKSSVSSSPKRRPPPLPSFPDDSKLPYADLQDKPSHVLPYTDLQDSQKAPLPKPRPHHKVSRSDDMDLSTGQDVPKSYLRKISKSDDIDLSLEESVTYPKPRPRKGSRSGKIDPPTQQNLMSPMIPVVRKRSGSKGTPLKDDPPSPAPRHRDEVVTAAPRHRDEVVTAAPRHRDEVVTASPRHRGFSPQHSGAVPTSAPVRIPAPRAKGDSTSASTQHHKLGTEVKLKAPPIPRKRGSKDVLDSPVKSPATPTNQYLQQRVRKKGGSIRIPLWKPPPPPSWTPPTSPTHKDQKPRDRVAQPLLAMSEMYVTPPHTPISTTSFILPPFSSSGSGPSPSPDPPASSPYPGPSSSYPGPSSPYPDLDESWVVMDLENPMKRRPETTSHVIPQITRTSHKPSFSGAGAVEVEEELFNIKTPWKGHGFQQQLPINVVHELQNNLRKQLPRRSGMSRME